MGVRLLFLGVFFASGVAALLYQVIWQRLLTFTTGADVYSVTIVVSAFMAGMGIGSLAGGALADRLDGRRRLVAFAACELAIAIFALLSATLYYDWLYTRLGARDLSFVARGALSFLATLWPTFFMGMSLPLAARALTDDARQPARWVPLLYGWNTLGAAFGAVLAVAVLFRTMDFESSLRVGAALSFTCAVAALLVAFRLPGRAGAGETDAAPAAPTRASWRSLREPVVLYALSGFIALSLEVVWFRILGVMLKSTALTFGHLLAIYLGGLGVGSLAANASRVQAWPARRGFLLSQAAIPIYAAVALAVLVAAVGRVGVLQPLWEYLGRYDGLTRSEALTKLSLVLGIGVPLWLMGPPTFLMGFSFGFLQRAVQTDLEGLGRRVGWLQAANIAGAVAGALLTGLVLLKWLGTPGTLRVLVAAGGVFLWLAASRGRWRTVAAIAVAGAVAIVPSPSVLWPRLHGTHAGTAVFAEDGSGIVLLRRNPDGSTTVHAQGLGQSQLPFGGIHTVLGALPVLLHPNPVRIAVIGLGSGDTTWAVGGRAETREIDSIEIVAPALTSLQALARQMPYAGLNQLLLDGRVRHHLTDGRAFLLKTDRRYDIIEADALRPNSAYAGNLYSVEYFTLIRSRLNPGGFAVTWTPTRRVVESIAAVFPHVVVAGAVAVASDMPIAFDPALVRQRLAHEFTAAYYANGRVRLAESLAPLLDRPPAVFGPDTARERANVNRDLFPRDEFKAGGRP